jgi:hypothetical protein
VLGVLVALVALIAAMLTWLRWFPPPRFLRRPPPLRP